MRKRRERKKQLFIRILVPAAMLIMIWVCGSIWYMITHPLKLKKTTIFQELKEDFSPVKNIKRVYFGKPGDVEIHSDVDVSKQGDYQVEYIYRKHHYKVPVKVRDTKPPVLNLHSYTTDLVEKIRPEFFINKVTDASEVTVKFEKKEDWSRENSYEVEIAAEDSNGNKTVKKAELIRKKDKTKPQIEGAQDLEISQGKVMDFRQGVTVKDDMDPEPTLEVDGLKVDFATPGTYNVSYVAKDRSGNKEKLVQKITVKEDKNVKQKIVYLTFDDGPSENTGKILDILKKYNVKATFFVTGTNQKKNNMIREAYEEGHVIGLHTYTHNYSSVYSSADAYFDDLRKISDMVEKITGEKSTVIRFPGGSSNTISKKYVPGLMTQLTRQVKEKGYQYFDWNCDSTDASGNNVPVEKLIENATACSSQYINILMHDTDAKDTTVEALPRIIEHYRSQGYAFKGITLDSYAAHHPVNN